MCKVGTEVAEAGMEVPQYMIQFLNENEYNALFNRGRLGNSDVIT